MMRIGCEVVILLFAISSVSCELKLQLDSSNENKWTVTNQNGSISKPATVPGGIYTDLQKAGILDKNLFYRFNDIDYRWVGKENWTYQLIFSITQDVLDKSAVNLVFLGLDTVGEMYLNEQQISTFDNMFVRYVINVKEQVKVGENNLTIVFASPVEIALSRHVQQSQLYPIPPYCDENNYQTECHVNYLRKMQASFSWDWGPAFPSVGVWKSVWIEAFDGAVVRDLTVHTSYDSTIDKYTITGIVFVDHAPGSPNGTISYSLKLNSINGGGGSIIKESRQLLKSDSGTSSNSTMTYVVDASMAQLWWPNGYGEQVMSEWSAKYTYLDEESSEKAVRFGFRTVELVQDPVMTGQNGIEFYFLVNNVAIFAKGTNWIPAHVLPELGYEQQRVKNLLTSAKQVNMNMLRVWGGGVYESDWFYQLADELGIMIWQDFMFAVALYPTNEEFVSSVRQEVEHQVKRIQHHPSIVVWAGNNENEAALTGAWWGQLSNYTIYYNDYVKLYVDTIQPIVEQFDPTRHYLISSPSNGDQTVADGYVSSDPYSPFYGDTHYYNYQSDGWDSNTFPDTRFASEYGYQSLPSFKTIQAVSELEDRYIDSNFSMSRQHHPNGYVEMTNLIKHHLPLPDDDRSEQYYQTYIYYSQISQAMSTKTETEKYRNDRNKRLVVDGRGVVGKTMGALYWQLNDVWQAPTWASIDFHGNWKMLHYYALNFFAPVLTSVQVSPDGIMNIFVASDVREEIIIRLNVTVFSYDSFEAKNVMTEDFIVAPLTSDVYMSQLLSFTLQIAGCPSPEACFIHASSWDATNSSINFPSNFYFPSSLTNATGLEHSEMTISGDKIADNEAQLNITVDRITLFVWLETDLPGQFSDNGFIMVNPTKTITFKSSISFSYDELQNTLTVRSLLGKH